MKTERNKYVEVTCPAGKICRQKKRKNINEQITRLNNNFKTRNLRSVSDLMKRMTTRFKPRTHFVGAHGRNLIEIIEPGKIDLLILR